MALASHQETLPTVVQQAMAARLPVVSTAVGGVPDIVENERTGLLVSPGDVQGLADALLRVLRNRALADSLAREARAYAEENFHASAVARRVMDVYCQVLNAETGQDGGSL
jgi:glycosyltransferase involved in cell wall biosynthesis